MIERVRCGEGSRGLSGRCWAAGGEAADAAAGVVGSSVKRFSAYGGGLWGMKWATCCLGSRKISMELMGVIGGIHGNMEADGDM